MKKRNIYRVLNLVFSGLTIVGSFYVILSGGKESAGYSVIPMVFSLIFASLARDRQECGSVRKPSLMDYLIITLIIALTIAGTVLIIITDTIPRPFAVIPMVAGYSFLFLWHKIKKAKADTKQ